MSLIYITGVAGSGKSTALRELKKRDYEAYGLDEEHIARFYNNQTGEPVRYPQNPADRTLKWTENHTWLTKRSEIEKLAKSAHHKPVFLCGVTTNTDELLNLFDRIFALTVDEATIKHRLANRTENAYGKTPHELAQVLKQQRSERKQYQRWNAVIIDAARPIEGVVDAILLESLN